MGANFILDEDKSVGSSSVLGGLELGVQFNSTRMERILEVN